MKKSSSEKFKSALSYGASLSDSQEKLSPWWKDPVKLVAAALNDDVERRRVLFQSLKELAICDKKFRLNLLHELKEIGKGQQGKRLKRPLWIDMMIFDHVNVIIQQKIARSNDDAFEKTSDFFLDNAIYPISPSSVRSIYYQVKKLKECKQIISVSTD